MAPSYKNRIIAALIFALILLTATVIMTTLDTYKYPGISYDKEWFVTNNGGNLLGRVFEDDEDIANLEQKVFLKSKTKLIPIAQADNRWFQVENPDGERGFVHFTLLSGSKNVEAVKKVWVYKKIGGERTDSISLGTSAIVIKRERKKFNYKTVDFIKVKFEDGRTRWAFDKDFKKLIFDSIPRLNSTYFFPTSINTLRKNILGDSIKSIEEQYGLATSIIVVDGVTQAYFRHLTVVDQKKHHKGVIFYLGKNDVVDSLKYLDGGKKQFYDHIPLVKQMRSMELTKVMNFSFYEDNIPKIQWWQNLDKSPGLFDSIFAWVFKWLLLIIIVFVFLSVGRQLIAPLVQIFTFNSIFSNSTVTRLNITLLFLATHLFYVYVILITEKWFVFGVIGLFVLGFWQFICTNVLEYNRCPSCYIMYSAVDKGNTKGGVSKEVSYESVTSYQGRDTKIEGSTKVITDNYLKWNEKTTDVYRHSTDHRQCYICDHEWGIGLMEKVDSYKEYE